MTNYVALLRAINLGSHNKVSMADLRGLFEELGFTRVKTVLQSGNVLFESTEQAVEELERMLEQETSSRLDLTTDYVVRSSNDLQTIVDRNPFPDEAKRDPGHLIAVFLKDAPSPKDVEELQAAIKGPERVRAVGKQAYVVYPDGIGRSKLTNVTIEKKLGCRGTGRNWNTVLKLAELAQT